MRQDEFESYSVGDFLILEMSRELRIRKLLENNKNIEEYNSFLQAEKAHTVPIDDLVMGKEYVPLGFNSAPEGELIILKQIDNFSKFIDTKSGKIFFDYKGKIIDFPLTKDARSAFLETLIFSDVGAQRHFITTLKLKFSTWVIKIYSA